MHRDTVFEEVYWLEKKQIRKKNGCENCISRGIKAWNRYSCKKGNVTNKHGFCNAWRYKE